MKQNLEGVCRKTDREKLYCAVKRRKEKRVEEMHGSHEEAPRIGTAGGRAGQPSKPKRFTFSPWNPEEDLLSQSKRGKGRRGGLL